MTIPIIAKYYIAEGFSLEAGPQISFLIKDEILSKTSDARLNPNSENFDIAMNLGFGYQLNKRFSVQTRYSIGTMDVDKEARLKNGVLQMTVGYRF